eukprot:gene4656-30852_t
MTRVIDAEGSDEWAAGVRFFSQVGSALRGAGHRTVEGKLLSHPCEGRGAWPGGLGPGAPAVAL